MQQSNVTLKIAIEGPVATLTLNRPEANNALDPLLIHQLSDALSELAPSETIRMVLLRGQGKNFCAGADLKHMQNMANVNIEENQQDAQKFVALLNQWYHFPKPTVCYVQGQAFGGALGLIAGSDFAIGENQSKFCFSEVKLGIAPAMIAPFVLGTIGLRQAKRWMLSADFFNATQAQKMGLLTEVVEHDNWPYVLDKLSTHIQAAGPIALKETKQLLQAIHIQTQQDWGKQTAELIARLRVSKEGQEGLQAFLEKRPTTWQKG